jgi:hypothetical protein
MNWKTIDSAPKDGTDILGYSKYGIAIVRWHLSSYYDGSKTVEFGTWAMVNEGEVLYVNGEVDDTLPTHWLEIPEPPKIN